MTKVSKKTKANLSKAKTAKQDEFYTKLSDIENELKYYKQHFKGKIVYCNCDDPMKSSFWKYFALNFKRLGLQKLITTCYKSQDINEHSQNDSKQAVCIEYYGNISGSGILEREDVKYIYLKGDGDFRSEECVNILKQADVVVTNPPFSLFREYVDQLIEYDKKFLIVGSLNAITYKNIFSLIKDNKLWVGYGNGAMTFKVPDNYVGTCEGDPGKKQASLGNISWYTNLDISKRSEDIILYKEYVAKDYPKYDNYDAIEVSKVAEIPTEYFGAMGVPITFLSKFNPTQFEIIKFRKGDDDKDLSINGKCPYFRIIIKRKQQ